MSGRSRARAAALLFAAVALQPARAQDPNAASMVGTYCLVGVREVGSCLTLEAGGRFEYFLAYGAYDEGSEGTWQWQGGEVVLDTPAYERQPTFTLKRLQRGDSDAFDVVVESMAGRPISGISVRATCDGRTVRAGVTGAGGSGLECRTAPTAVSLGLEMYGLAYQTIDVSGRTGTDRVYVFEFDPGDLGRKKFVGHRLRPRDGNALVMIYRDTPIRELDGRPFPYVRQ
jgi:hypothetical protein